MCAFSWRSIFVLYPTTLDQCPVGWIRTSRRQGEPRRAVLTAVPALPWCSRGPERDAGRSERGTIRGVEIAITGGTGFIGSRLAAAHLARGDRVRLLTRRPPRDRPTLPGEPTWLAGDLRDLGSELLPFVDGADVLYHCAGELRDRTAMKALHVGGTRRLINTAAGRVGRWVQLSSVGVYGPRTGGTITEDTPPFPQGAYEETKAAADVLVQEAHAAGKLEATILRPSIVFGPGMPGGSLRQWIAMVRRRLFFFIGPPGASANYVPAASTVEALIVCGTHPAASGKTFVLSEHDTVERFVGWIADESGVPVPRLRVPAPPVRLAARVLGTIPGVPLTPSRVAALTTRARYSQTKIEDVLAFRPSITLELAVRLTVQDVLARMR
jgi:nucleoside-diphosphate-sugar epimerase